MTKKEAKDKKDEEDSYLAESLTVPHKLSTLSNRRNSRLKSSAQSSRGNKDSLFAATPIRNKRKHISIFNRIKNDMDNRLSKIKKKINILELVTKPKNNMEDYAFLKSPLNSQIPGNISNLVSPRGNEDFDDLNKTQNLKMRRGRLIFHFIFYQGKIRI